MDSEQRQKLAESQLDRILGFFPRVDAKNSVVLAINTGMLSLLVANISNTLIHSCVVYFSIIPVLLIGVSMYHLYKGAFPKLKGNSDSLIYFRSIGSLSESEYAKRITDISQDEYVKDLLGQISRNSEILKEKYNHLEQAFKFMAFALVPWLIVFAIFIITKNAEQSAQFFIS